MVMRKTVGQVLDQQAEKKEYFNSKYSFSKVTGLTAGMEVYCIPLNLENGLYQLAKHTVKARGPKQGFKGWFDTPIICKGVNPDGTKNPDALCCQLAKEEYNKYPEDYQKRMILSTSYVTYIPVLILGCIDSTKGALRYPPSKLSIKTFQFSYLEMSSNSFNKEILTPFVNKLKDEGIVDYSAEGSELEEQVMKHLSRSIIKVTANKTDNKALPYERSYSFVPFSNQTIGADSNQYKYITNYNKITSVHNAIVDYITLFDSEVDGLCKDWTEEELINYIKVDSVRSNKIAEAVSDTLPKSEQVVTLATPASDTTEVVDFEMIEEINPDVDVEDFGEIEEPTKATVEETFEDFDDSMLSLEEDSSYFLDDEN